MALVNKTVQVTKEADELAEGLVATVQHVKKALSDGWQPGQDLPVVLQAVLADLIPAIQGVEKLGAEITENEEAFVTSFVLAGKKLVYVFKQPVKA